MKETPFVHSSMHLPPVVAVALLVMRQAPKGSGVTMRLAREVVEGTYAALDEALKADTSELVMLGRAAEADEATARAALAVGAQLVDTLSAIDQSVQDRASVEGDTPPGGFGHGADDKPQPQGEPPAN